MLDSNPISQFPPSIMHSTAPSKSLTTSLTLVPEGLPEIFALGAAIGNPHSRINSRAILYHLISPFSLIRQPKRKSIKKEKSFAEFTENFKKDFLKNFDSILKRIVGSRYKDAKKEIQDKARQMEMENKMMLSGLDDPLEGPNSLTLLDQFLTEFEEAYSDFFGERLDIQELSKHFTREKIMTSFMYFIYTGKLLDR